MASHRPRIALTIMFLQRFPVQIPLLVAASALTEILRTPEKDIVVCEERAFFPEHNGGNSIFLARLMPLLGQILLKREYLCFKFIPQ